VSFTAFDRLSVSSLRCSDWQSIAAPESATSAASRRLDRGDVYLLHTHSPLKVTAIKAFFTWTSASYSSSAQAMG
jgi:hypothetical protein